MRVLVIAAISFAVIGCAKKHAPAPASTSAAAAVATAAVEAPAEPARIKNPRVKDAAVYVDGKIIGFLKHQELPITLKPAPTHRSQIDYGFASYLQSMDVDIQKVRAMHLHGGTIGGFVAIVPGDSVRKAGDRLRFSFQPSGKGRARPVFDGIDRNELGINTSVDTINAVALYIDKEPPRENQNYRLSYPDGTPVKGVAYADEETSAGTRVYLDGKLVSIVKRKSLSNDLLATTDLSKPEFSLAAYLKSVGIDVAQTKSVSFIANDQAIAHDASNLKKLTFAVPARNQGLAMIDLGGQAGADAQRITAIQLYRSVTVPQRAATPRTATETKIHKG